jgi:hypothetical protein
MNDAATRPGSPDGRSLFRLGGAAAFLVALLTVLEVVVFALLPQPGTVEEWFALFLESPVGGLIAFWGLEILMYAAFVPVFLALYAVLGRAGPGAMAVALALSLIGCAVFFAANNPFSMLTRSNRYAAASTGAAKGTLLAAGEAVLALTNQRAVGGFNIALFLVSAAGLIVSAVMLRSTVFARSTAYVGIAAFALSLADYLRQALTSSELVALLVILPGALLLVLWFALTGVRLLRLGSGPSRAPTMR